MGSGVGSWVVDPRNEWIRRGYAGYGEFWGRRESVDGLGVGLRTCGIHGWVRLWTTEEEGEEGGGRCFASLTGMFLDDSGVN